MPPLATAAMRSRCDCVACAATWAAAAGSSMMRNDNRSPQVAPVRVNSCTNERATRSGSGCRIRTPPRPWLVVVRPSASSRRSAIRTVSRLTPRRLTSSPSLGRQSPGASSPDRICRRRLAATTSGARDGLARVIRLSILSTHGECPQQRRAQRRLPADAVRGDCRGLCDDLSVKYPKTCPAASTGSARPSNGRPAKVPTDCWRWTAWFKGSSFDNGRADFRNRWVRTPKYLLEDKHQRGMFSWSDGEWTDWRNIGFGAAVPDEHTRGIPQGTNNINCFPFAGEILASGEQGSPPVALDPITLQTRGVVAWSPQLSRGIFDRAGLRRCGIHRAPEMGQRQRHAVRLGVQQPPAVRHRACRATGWRGRIPRTLGCAVLLGSP